MKTTLMGFVAAGCLLSTSFGQSDEGRELLAVVAKTQGPEAARARAMLSNPIQSYESRAAWDDRLARAVEIEAGTWTKDKETAYTTRYQSRVAAQAEAAKSRIVADAIDRQTDAIRDLQRR